MHKVALVSRLLVQSRCLLVLEDFMFLWRWTKEVQIICPRRFVVDATENSKEGGVAAEVYSPQTGS